MFPRREVREMGHAVVREKKTNSWLPYPQQVQEFSALVCGWVADDALLQ